MSRGLLFVNVLLLAVAATAAAFVIREVRQPLTLPGASRARPVDGAPSGNEPETPRPAPGGYGSVASRNLFSPTRSEAPVVAAPVKPAVVLPKPNLFGVVVREGSPIAYLEDPTTKRVAGYHLGDTVAGGTVKTIDADHVVLDRPDGPIDVQLRDPARPRPAAPAAAAPGQPGFPQPGAPATGVVQPGGPPQPQPQGIQQVPGFPPQRQGVQQPGVQPPGVQPPGVQQPGQVSVPQPPQALQQPPPVAQPSPSPGTVIPRLRRGPAGGRFGGE
jgi:hypothetical protein